MYSKHCELRRNNLYFGGCDYYGLANNSQVVNALVDAAREWGISTGASRFTSGNHRLHTDLESLIAESTGTDACTIFPSGYLANVAIAETLYQLGLPFLRLKDAHPSIGCHRDQHLSFKTSDELMAAIIEREARRDRYAVFIDAVDPITGATQNAARLLEIVKSGLLVIDYSHIFGLSLHRKISRKANNIVITSSLSKVIGQHGGFVSASFDFINQISNAAPSLKYATPLPPALCASAIQAIRLCSCGSRFNSLQRNINTFEFRTKNYIQHIDRGIPVYALSSFGDESALALSQRLMKGSIFIPYIENYGGTGNGVMRISLSSVHTEDEVNHLCDALTHLKAHA